MFKYFDDNGTFINFTNKKEKNHTTTKPLKPLFLGEKAYFENNNWNYSYDETFLNKFTKENYKAINKYDMIIYSFIDLLYLLNKNNKYNSKAIYKRNNRFSVCIPCFGKLTKNILETLQSVLTQSVLPNEIIFLLMDRESASLKKVLEKKDKKIKCYISERLYVADARIKLANLSNEDWICFLDADDILPKDFFKNMFLEKTEADAYFSKFNFHDNKQNEFYDYGNICGLINKNIFLKYSYDKQFRWSSEDHFFIFNCLINNIKIHFVESTLIEYFIDSDHFFYHLSGTAKNLLDSENLLKRFFPYIDSIYKNNQEHIKKEFYYNIYKKYKKTRNLTYYLHSNYDIITSFLKGYAKRKSKYILTNILYSRKRTPIKNKFISDEYTFINFNNIKDIEKKYFYKRIENFSFDVIFFTEINFLDFYLGKVKYIVRKELSNLSPIELINKYCCGYIKIFNGTDYNYNSFIDFHDDISHIINNTNDAVLKKELKFFINARFLENCKPIINDDRINNQLIYITFYFDNISTRENNIKNFVNALKYIKDNKKNNYLNFKIKSNYTLKNEELELIKEKLNDDITYYYNCNINDQDYINNIFIVKEINVKDFIEINNFNKNYKYEINISTLEEAKTFLSFIKDKNLENTVSVKLDSFSFEILKFLYIENKRIKICNCNLHNNNAKEIIIFLSKNKLSRCTNSFFLEDITNWDKQIHIEELLCSNCPYKKINYLN